MKQEERYKHYQETHNNFIETLFILTNHNGTPFCPEKLVRRMARFLKLTNVKKHTTPHIFRHTHITMLIEASLNLDLQLI
ncbi:tyrosine-type recombinase/integrase [Paenibacillus borealis]|uniref:tyrosine-type recombinase/integrase n=1 Tax=Paenibacillus TaxID=44249 RepID=UPI0009FB1847